MTTPDGRHQLLKFRLLSLPSTPRQFVDKLPLIVWVFPAEPRGPQYSRDCSCELIYRIEPGSARTAAASLGITLRTVGLAYLCACHGALEEERT